MPRTYVPITSYTLGSAQSSITFNSLIGYDDLRFIIRAGTSNSGYLLGLRINGDSGANYSYVVGGGNITASNSIYTKGGMVMAGVHQQLTSGLENMFIVDFFDITNTAVSKQFISRGGSPAGEVRMTGGVWHTSNSAITSISFAECGDGGTGTFGTGTISAGSRFDLYGIVRA